MTHQIEIIKSISLFHPRDEALNIIHDQLDELFDISYELIESDLYTIISQLTVPRLNSKETCLGYLENYIDYDNDYVFPYLFSNYKLSSWEIISCLNVKYEQSNTRIPKWLKYQIDSNTLHFPDNVKNRLMSSVFFDSKCANYILTNTKCTKSEYEYMLLTLKIFDMEDFEKLINNGQFDCECLSCVLRNKHSAYKISKSPSLCRKMLEMINISQLDENILMDYFHVLLDIKVYNDDFYQIFNYLATKCNNNIDSLIKLLIRDKIYNFVLYLIYNLDYTIDTDFGNLLLDKCTHKIGCKLFSKQLDILNFLITKKFVTDNETLEIACYKGNSGICHEVLKDSYSLRANSSFVH